MTPISISQMHAAIHFCVGFSARLHMKISMQLTVIGDLIVYLTITKVYDCTHNKHYTRIMNIIINRAALSYYYLDTSCISDLRSSKN
jgi:hypothetical protein